MFVKTAPLLLMLTLGALLPLPAQAQFTGQLFPLPQNTAVSLDEIAANFARRGVKSPKGLEYREVEISVDESNTAVAVKTHGWIVSPAKGTAKALVLAWNGWTYPALSVGAKADIEADVKAVETSSQEEAKRLGWGPPAPPVLGYADTVSVLYQTVAPFKMVMLKLLGEDELAQRVYALFMNATSPIRLEGMVEGDWFWPRFNRGIEHFRTGKDRSALDYIREASTVGQSKSEFHRRYAPVVSLLMDELERRIKEKPPTNPNSREYLLWDLQNVSFTQRSKISSVDPRIPKLAARSDVSVEALLEIFLHDKRLTRRFELKTVWPGGGGSVAGPSPIPGSDIERSSTVSHAALDVLDSRVFPTNNKYILLFRTLQDKNTPQGRIMGRPPGGRGGNAQGIRPEQPDLLSEDQIKQAVADQFRLDWAELGRLSVPERLYQILKLDVDSNEDQWLRAANALVSLRDSADPKSPLLGEPLRDGRIPSVSDLLDKRISEVTAREKENSSWREDSLTSILLRWDKAAGQKQIVAQMKAILEAQKADPSLQDKEMYNLMKRVPEEAGRHIYAEWLRRLPRGNLNWSSMYFTPLWEHVDDPFWQETARQIFTDPASPWHEVLPPGESPNFYGLMHSFLLVVPEWNMLLRKSLNDTRVVGTLEWQETEPNTNRYAHVRLTGSDLQFTPIDIRNIDLEPRGTKPLTLGDYMGWMLSDSWQYPRGAPQFNPMWAPEKKAKALADLDAWLASQSGKKDFVIPEDG